MSQKLQVIYKNKEKKSYIVFLFVNVRNKKKIEQKFRALGVEPITPRIPPQRLILYHQFSFENITM